MGGKTLKMVPFGATNGPNVDQDGGQGGDMETQRYKSGQKWFWRDFGSHFGSQNGPKLRPEVTKKGSEKTTPKTEGSVLHFGTKSDQT